MEYNIDLLDGVDIYGENALTLILKQMMPGSRVLEFGSAYGRMTRFMKKNLKCWIICVEMNRKTKEHLEKTADKVIIGNIEDYYWEKELESEKFDYIIFADVLEHLVDPEKALKRAKFYLKENGIIFVSVPNVAHNAIVRSLLLNRFMYQDYGILDRTHLHFFAKETLEELVKECGLYVCSRLATYYDDAMTGVLNNMVFEDVCLQQILQQREFGQVYQFVYGLCKTDIEDKNKDMKMMEIVKENGKKYQNNDICKIYIDIGNGYSEDLAFEQKYSLLNTNTVEFNFGSSAFIHNFRIDPTNNSCVCIVYQIFVQDASKKKYQISFDQISSNALYQIQNIYVFDQNDPQIIISGIYEEITEVRIVFDVLCKNVISKDYFMVLKYISEIIGKKEKLETVNNELQCCIQEIERLEKQIKKVQKECLKLQDEKIQLTKMSNIQYQRLFEKNLRIVQLEDEKLKQSIAGFQK